MALQQLGPYRIQELLGRGGMGAVYAGIHEETGERVAIKVLPELMADDERFRSRFQGEVETLKKLRHDSIVALRGYGEQDGMLFFVMELVEGQSLDVDIKAGRQFTWQETLNIAGQVCAALKHAHDSGVIHRDLKPANLMRTPQGVIKLTDFGIARLFGSQGLTMQGAMIGTPEYMSPEQAVGEPVTPRSDLYSLGCVMYALIAGRPPFSGMSITMLLDKVRNDEPPSLQDFSKQVPSEVDELICQLLRKKPEQRIGSAMTLGRLIKAMQHALSIERKAAESAPAVMVGPADRTGIVQRTHSDSLRPKGTVVEEEDTTRELMPTKLNGSVMDDPRWEVDGQNPDITRENTGPSAEVRTAAAERNTPPTPKTHFVPVTDEDRRRLDTAAEDQQAAPHWHWLTIGGIVAVLLTIAIAFVMTLLPESADRLYAQAIAAMAANPPTFDGEQSATEFLTRFPADPRSAELRRQLDDFRCMRLRYDLEHKLRNLTAGEKLFLKGMLALDTQQPADAVAAFEQILDELAENAAGSNEQKLLDCTQHLLRRLRTAVPAPQSEPDA
jgi:serine/threonine protein kinase